MRFIADSLFPLLLLCFAPPQNRKQLAWLRNRFAVPDGSATAGSSGDESAPDSDAEHAGGEGDGRDQSFYILGVLVCACTMPKRCR